MKYLFKAQTDVGKIRDHNEDFLLTDEKLGLFVVCDGMGGHAAGEIASQMAASEIKRLLTENASLLESQAKSPKNTQREQIKTLLSEIIAKACQKIWDTATQDSSKKGMGTTLAMLLVSGQEVFVAHVGDSRVYLLRQNKLHQLTMDHSFVNELLKEGMITPEQALNHPKKNVITRALGIGPVVNPDVLHMEVMEKDRFFICSDGIMAHLNNQDIEKGLKLELNDTVSTLIKNTNEKGGKDNITAIVVDFQASEGTASKEHSGQLAKKLETLGKIPLFSELTYQQMMKILELIEVRTFEAQDQIIKEGEEGQEMYIILQGSSKVCVKQKEINRLQAGNYFGEMALIDNAPRSATVTSLEKMRTLVLSRDKLFGLLKKDTEMASKVYWFFLNTLITRLRRYEAQSLK